MKTPALLLTSLVSATSRARDIINVHLVRCFAILALITQTCLATFSGQFVGATAESPLIVGADLKISVTVKNTGTSTWYSSFDNPSWLVVFPGNPKITFYRYGNVPPGETITGIVEYPAEHLPTTAGNYSLTLFCYNPDGENNSRFVIMDGPEKTVTFTVPPQAGALQFSALSYNVDENGGNASIVVTRVGGSVGAVSVTYATSDGTAVAGRDYTAASGTLSWANGDTASKTLTIAISDNTTYATNKTVKLTLSNSTGGAILGVPSMTDLTIVENDPPKPIVVGTDVELSFFSAAGESHHVDYSDDLITWAPLADVSGTGFPVSVIDPMAARLAKRFYRVSVGGRMGIPSGFIQLTIPAAANGVPVRMPISNPFQRPASTAGALTSVGGSVLTDAAAAWTPNQWTASPHLVRMTSGVSDGRFFLITSHTTTELTVDASGADQSTVLRGGDGYEICPAETLGSLFGTTSVSLGRGATALAADQVKLWNGAAWDIYYQNGTEWRLNGSTQNQNATVVLPDEGMFIVHRRARPVKLFFAGIVPTTVQKTELPGPGSRFAANRFPGKMTLLNSGIAALPGWRVSRNVSQADTVQLWIGGRFLTCYFNGAHWKAAGSTAIQDNVNIQMGGAFFVKRKSIVAGLEAFLSQMPPY